MKRRGFFSAIIGSALAACGVGVIPHIVANRSKGIVFHTWYNWYHESRQVGENQWLVTTRNTRVSHGVRTIVAYKQEIVYCEQKPVGMMISHLPNETEQQQEIRREKTFGKTMKVIKDWNLS